MPGLRGHEPIVIEEFNGLWARGDPESAPSDHFVVADNVQYFNSGVETRIPLDKYQAESSHLEKVKRTYNYVMQTGQSLLVLVDGGLVPSGPDAGKVIGKIYHIVNGVIRGPSGNTDPILVINGMEDFGFVAIAGRAYITPFHILTNTQGIAYELGLPGEFMYVYKGDGTIARKAAGFPPVNTAGGTGKPMIAYNSQTEGLVTLGVHIIGIGFDGGIVGTEARPVVEAPGGKEIQVENIPTGTAVRSLVMTRAIDPKDYNPTVAPTWFLVEILPDAITTSRKINIADTSLTTPYIPTAGAPPGVGGMVVENTYINGFCDIGFHLVGVVFETDSGYLTAPGPATFGGNTYIDTKKSVRVFQIPTSADPAVVKRHLVSTKTIFDYNGDQKGYQFFFIPKATIESRNVGTELIVNYYDSDLVADASHLIDNYSEIPATVNLNTYHSRLVMVGDPSFPKKLDGVTVDSSKPDNRSVAWLSAPGEPEAINKVDGLLITPLDGSPLTNVQEFRDVLYLFKKNRTYAYSDNFDEPATWKEEVLDQGVGAPVHGVATVLDSGGVNVDFLIIADWSGLMLFNGTYARPELSWKIEDIWKSMDSNKFRQIQIVNDTLNKKIWMTTPDPLSNRILFADYGNGLDAKSIRWARWIFAAKMSTVTLIDTDKVIFGASGNASVLENS